ncbi:hypothetical protein V1478_002783 [Vespula squamosa]|uniref:Uncharacterized protein n=1 Tax=Vespula squamosa TaxID=30214 RepID=A0ABD2BSU3_VESSQ
MSSPVISPQWYPEFEVDTTVTRNDRYANASIDISANSKQNVMNLRRTGKKVVPYSSINIYILQDWLCDCCKGTKIFQLSLMGV